MNFLEKLDLMMTTHNLNKNTLSKKCSIPYTTIDGWYKKGYAGLKLSTLKKLSSFFQVPLDYWVEHDNQTDTVLISNEEKELLEHFRKLNRSGREKALIDIADLTEIEKYINNFYTVKRVAREGTVEYVTVTDDDIEGYSKLETPSDEV